MSYRDDLDALAARHAALDAEVNARTKERDDVAHMLDDARKKTRLPVLDNITIATPCKADWSKMTRMTEDDRVRECGDCNKRVYNLSEMTREQAQALIIAHDGDLCARYYQRADGTIILKDCEIGIAARRRQKWIAAGAAVFLAGSAGAAAMALHRTGGSAADVEIAAPPVEFHTPDRQTAHEHAPPPPPPKIEILEPPPMPTMGAVAIPMHEDDLPDHIHKVPAPKR